MNRAIPSLAALQWVGGLILAYAAIRRARTFRRAGAWPLGIGRVAMAVFIVAGVLIILTMPLVARLLTPWITAFGTADRWRLGAFLQLSQVAWVLVIVSSAWNGVLGIIGRKRAARAELARRRARARGDHGA